jgi:hypothetical protein
LETKWLEELEETRWLTNATLWQELDPAVDNNNKETFTREGPAWFHQPRQIAPAARMQFSCDALVDAEAPEKSARIAQSGAVSRM